jgi:hypothetical protein
VQLDAAHDEPIAFTLAPAEIAATVDLDGAEASLAALAPMMGGSAPTPSSLHGQISASLFANQVWNQVELHVSIDRDLAIAFGDASFASPASDGLFLNIQTDPQFATGSIAFGDTRVRVDGGAGLIEEYELPALGATFQITDNVVLAKDLTLGRRPATYQRDGRLAASVALNPDDGHATTVTYKHDANGYWFDALTKFDLRFTTDHAVLGDDAPAFDVTRYLLDGGPSNDSEVWMSNTGNEIRALGPLAIETNPAAYGLSLARSQCAKRVTVADAASGTSFEQWQAATCTEYPF